MSDDAPTFQDVDSSSEEARAAALLALDLQAQLPPIQRLHAWLLEHLDPQPGMHVADVGCGTGEDVRGLALAVAPTGTATGIDPSATMLAEAHRRNEAARSPARLVRGSAEDLPFDDGSLDLVRSERVLQHLADPAVAVREMARVLKPGGRVGLIDTDWRSLATWPGEPHLAAAWREDWVGFPTPATGAQLLDLVLSNGFADARVTTEVLMLRPRSLDQPPAALALELAARRAEAAGEGQAWRRELEEAAARGAFVFAVTLYGVVAVRT